MALLLLIILGATLGWLATILVREELRNPVLIHVAIGAVGASVMGVIGNNGAILGGLSFLALLAGIGGAALMLTGYRLWLRRESTG